MINPQLVTIMREFMENEARSCSMDFGCITPLYAYRMLGGKYDIGDVLTALIFCLNELKTS